MEENDQKMVEYISNNLRLTFRYRCSILCLHAGNHRITSKSWTSSKQHAEGRGRDLMKSTVMPNTPLICTLSSNCGSLKPRELNSLCFSLSLRCKAMQPATWYRCWNTSGDAQNASTRTCQMKQKGRCSGLLHPWPHQLFLSPSSRAVNLLTGAHVSWGISPGPAGLTFLTQACNTAHGDTVKRNLMPQSRQPASPSTC